MKCFGPATKKVRPCKLFAKLKGNHLLMDNIFTNKFFKLHKHQTFGVLEMHNMSKSDTRIINSVCDSSSVIQAWFTVNGLSKMLFFDFCLFQFFKFQTTIAKNVEKTILFCNGFWVLFVKFYYVTNIFDLHTFHNEATALLNFLKFPRKCVFCFFIFSKWNLSFDGTFKMYCWTLF